MTTRLDACRHSRAFRRPPRPGAPRPESLPALRVLLAELTAAEAPCQGDANTEAMRLRCVHLFCAADPQDLLAVWRAKAASMDDDASIEVQLLCSAGREATRAYLAAEGWGDALAALRRFEEAVTLGDLDDFDAVRWAEEALAYFLSETPWPDRRLQLQGPRVLPVMPGPAHLSFLRPSRLVPTSPSGKT